MDLGLGFKIKNVEFITYKAEYFVIIVGIIKDKYKFKNTVMKIISVNVEEKKLGGIIHDVQLSFVGYGPKCDHSTSRCWKQFNEFIFYYTANDTSL